MTISPTFSKATPTSILLSKLLDLHLCRALARLHSEDPLPMSAKFKALADRVANTKKAWNQRADDLHGRLDKMEARGDEAFRRHESLLDVAEAGFRDLEDAVRDLEGANNPPSEASPGAGDGSFRG